MNHNGVISLPTDGTNPYLAGEIISVNASGQAVANVLATGVGVVMHDVDPTATERPVDIHLFSAGGMMFILADGDSAAAGGVGGPILVGDAVGFESASKVLQKAGTTPVGYALEATDNASGLIRVLIA
jgi:hypothetical protein